MLYSRLYLAMAISHQSASEETSIRDAAGTWIDVMVFQLEPRPEIDYRLRCRKVCIIPMQHASSSQSTSIRLDRATCTMRQHCQQSCNHPARQDWHRATYCQVECVCARACMCVVVDRYFVLLPKLVLYRVTAFSTGAPTVVKLRALTDAESHASHVLAFPTPPCHLGRM